MPTVSIPERFLGEYLSVSQYERDDLRADVLTMIERGKTPREIVEVMVSAGWGRDFSDWYAHLADVHKENLTLSTKRYVAPVKAQAKPLPWFLIGLPLIIFSRLRLGDEMVVVQLATTLAGVICWGKCLSIWAENKGHSPSYGFLAIIPCIGFLAVASLPDRLIIEDDRA